MGLEGNKDNDKINDETKTKIHLNSFCLDMIQYHLAQSNLKSDIQKDMH